MSAGAVFKLIANDGKADRMIMATKLLNQRIKDVMCARSKAGNADVTPTLVDLERTHILYVNAHFKPFAAIGYEYNKVTPQNGSNNLGSGITFSIPQFGDFFHDMVCRVRLSQATAVTSSVPGLSDRIPHASCSPTNKAIWPEDGYNEDGTVNANATYVIVDVNGNEVTGTYRNLVRYCEYPGNRLFKLVKFDVNGNPLDQYDQMIPTMIEKFCTLPHKRIGHDRLVGQEVPVAGYKPIQSASVLDPDTNTPNNISKFTKGQSNQTVGLYNSSAVSSSTTVSAPLSSSANVYDVGRELMQVVNGPQTPKPIQPPLEIWNKTRFWFNEDVRLSIPSVSIPFGQRYITIDLASQNDMLYESPSIFVKKVVNDTNSTSVRYTPYFRINGVNDVTIENIELYINNIFVNPEIHDIYIKRIGFSLIRVFRQHTQTCSQSGNDEKLLSQLKWPVEYMFVGLRPRWNNTAISNNTGVSAGSVSGNQYVWRDWHRLTKMVNAVQNTALDLNVNVGGVDSVVSSGKIMNSEYYLPVPTVDALSLTSHGITIFDSFNDTFFNQYMPFHYGGTALTTPDDVGALFINMALFPRSYQPSGHLNISRARETYLKWTTSYISPSTSADLLVIAVAINFLLISDGSCVLRYST
jgi:Large eukaryotic DNA virus major capsid protein